MAVTWWFHLLQTISEEQLHAEFVLELRDGKHLRANVKRMLNVLLTHEVPKNMI